MKTERFSGRKAVQNITPEFLEHAVGVENHGAMLAGLQDAARRVEDGFSVVIDVTETSESSMRAYKVTFIRTRDAPDSVLDAASSQLFHELER